MAEHMSAQDYRLKDAQSAARICIKAMRLSDEDTDSVAFWARTAGRAALNYLDGHGPYQIAALRHTETCVRANDRSATEICVCEGYNG